MNEEALAHKFICCSTKLVAWVKTSGFQRFLDFGIADKGLSRNPMNEEALAH
jgi:hypothetical protein